MATSSFLSDQEQANVLAAISDAESHTSGEIRLHLESRCRGDVLDRAAVVFETLAMHKTALRNGVLIYLATEDRKFAILGDGGINAVVPDNFWNEVKNRVIDGLTTGKPGEGLASGIRLAGEQLSAHFPLEANDINELSNDISFGS